MVRIFSVFLLSSVIFQCFCSSFGILGNETDRLALLAFKSQITQDPQKVLSSWNSSNHFCQWKGVICGRRHQRVKVLSLWSTGIGGLISPHIGNLSFLRALYLDNNTFYGKIPQELGQLFRLEELVLGSNALVGEIPVNISICSNLKQLHISQTNLVGKIPAELGSLQKLVILALEDSGLTGEIPPSLGNLTSLESLALSQNSLEGVVPSTLSQLERLKIMSLALNKLSGIFPTPIYNISTLSFISLTKNFLQGNFPSDIGASLPNLQSFLVGYNQFSGPFPASFFNISALQKFEIAYNEVTGEVPLTIGNLKNLEVLLLIGNDLGSGKEGDLDFLTPLTNCTHLQTLGIAINKFGGILPTSIGNFSQNLTKFDLGENQISGYLPIELGNLQNLIGLVLSSNFFRGSIPKSFGNMQQLQVLDLGNNQLSGEVLFPIRNMSMLYQLHMSNNSLEGSISSILQNQALQILHLSFNNFSGPIPEEIGLSSNFQEFSVAYNSLNGTIPLGVGDLKSIRYFIVGENNMSGEIPNSLGGCVSLQYLFLEGNSFYGPLPSLDSLTDLRSLNVSHNNLSGNISEGLAKLSALTSLDLSFNNFVGEVPKEGIFQNESAISVSGNYEICGGIPELKLPKCNSRSIKKGDDLVLKVVLGVLIPSFMVGFSLLIFYLRKKPEPKSQPNPCLEGLKKVSYSDLHKATNGFSSTNLIGTGSYGSVYKGALPGDEGYIAVKVLNLMEHGALKTFMTECEVLREIRHRNLLKILTVCSSIDFNGDDFKALVFEFMPNGSLETWLHPFSDGQNVSVCLNIYQLLDIAIDVADSLDYLHNQCEKPIVHCDLKPSNVLLNNDLIAIVADFGLSKVLSEMNSFSLGQTETSSSGLRGTIGYIPPEYGVSGKVSAEGDIYSYGILLLEMFTGRRPTDDMFKDGLSLRDFTKKALSEQVMGIIDERILSDGSKSQKQMEGCLTSIIKIGVACSADLMTERLNIKDVLKELRSIKAIIPQV
ncbi:hypothetical protein ACHQM5_021008 [Ranunculus cassubicifolius]